MKRIAVDLRSQTLSAFDQSKLVFKFDCVTGSGDHPTEPGSFHVFLKDKNHISKKYHAKMHYALFFSRDGKAIHQYHGPFFESIRSLKQNASDWFGSHGCVRLREADAKALFEWAPMHTLVAIT